MPLSLTKCHHHEKENNVQHHSHMVKEAQRIVVELEWDIFVKQVYQLQDELNT